MNRWFPLVVVPLLVTGCGAATRSAPTMAPGSSSKAQPSPAISSSQPGLLRSQSATLDALRAQDRRRPLSVLVPGAAGPALIQPRTTDPVSGGLDLPKNAAAVAWWASGTGPGEQTGTVVLAAHVVYQGQTGPFTHLNRLRRGAMIIVTSADGTSFRYRVQGIRSAPKAALDRAALFTSTGPQTLALVTCGGSYDPVSHSFADNLVVTALPVS